MFAALLTAANVAHAEHAEPDNALEADLGSGVIGVGYERVLAPSVTARATFQLNRPWYTQYLGGPESDVVGFGLELRPFVFPFAAAPRGFYLSPFGRVVAIRAQDDLADAESGVGWSAGATAGYGWLLADDALLLRFGAGAQYWAFETDHAGLSGVYPDVDIIVGYGF